MMLLALICMSIVVINYVRIVALDPERRNRANRFHTIFKKAYDKIDAQVKHDSFESCVLEIQSDDLVDFIDVLHYYYK